MLLNPIPGLLQMTNDYKEASNFFLVLIHQWLTIIEGDMNF